MIKKIIVLVLILILAAVGTAIYFFNKKVPSLENVKADFIVSADELFDQFEKDETAALKIYEGKVIEVYGEVIDVTVDSSTTVVLKAENAMLGGVNCSFKNTVNGVEKGEKLRVKGKCQGFLMDVIINNCVLADEE